jgi:pterin-4a-carbinolamine dehydratase
MRNRVIFVSYRREDTGPFALALRSELDLRLQGMPVFIDLNRIQGGDAWSNVLEDALAKTKVVIALIGENWIGVREDGPRIRADDDWVAREVAHGLSTQSILPLLVNGAGIPDMNVLPPALQGLPSIQALPLRTQSWEADLRMLCETLQSRFGATLKQSSQMLPKPSRIKSEVAPLSDEELEHVLQASDWNVEVVHDVTTTGAVREFLRKKYLFQKDRDAFEFLHRIGGLTKKYNHHPIIEAKYADVVLRLSTWDAGHRITRFDARFAADLDKLSRRWPMRSADG